MYQLFIFQVTQLLVRALGANWKLHYAYRPQSFGQVEDINSTLKETITKLTLETASDKVALLPFALYRVWNLSYALGLIPYAIMFGRPPPILPNLKSDLTAKFDDVTWLFPSSLWLSCIRTYDLTWEPFMRQLHHSHHTSLGQEIGSSERDIRGRPLNHAGKGHIPWSWQLQLP